MVQQTICKLVFRRAIEKTGALFAQPRKKKKEESCGLKKNNKKKKQQD